MVDLVPGAGPTTLAGARAGIKSFERQYLRSTALYLRCDLSA